MSKELRCEAGTTRGQCERLALFKVEKQDLSHRKLHYCDDHAKPYKAYPDDFCVTTLEIHHIS